MLSFANQLNANDPVSSEPSLLTDKEQKAFQDKTVNFLTIVFKLNMTDYKTADIVTSQASDGIFITFKFRQTESNLDVCTKFRDNEVIWCKLYPVEGMPSFIESEHADVLSNAKDTLNRLQMLSAKESLSAMQNMLNPITDLQNSETSNKEFTQEITVKENEVTISWSPFANGLINQQNQMTLRFTDGYLMFFANYLGENSIGTSDVKISEEQATQIAIEQVKAFSWVQGNELVSNVTVLDEPFFTQLSLQNRGNNTLYPLWEIKLGLDKMYPGGVTSFQVFIWADNGEVSSVRPIGVGSAIGNETTETPTASPINNQSTFVDSLAIVSTLVIATLVIGSLILFKKRK